jgi:thioredoxin-related protein
MKTNLRCAALGLMVFWFAFSVCASHAFSSGVKWYTYKEGIERGKHEKKNVFLNFYADWCGFCKKMDRETFKDPAVISYLNENFISVRVNSDKQLDIARQYYVTGLPVSWFIAENGEKISSLPGYVPADLLLNILKYIYTDKYKEMSFKDFLTEEPDKKKEEPSAKSN